MQSVAILISLGEYQGIHCSRNSTYTEPGTEIHELLWILFFKKSWASGGCCCPQKAVWQGERSKTSY